MLVKVRIHGALRRDLPRLQTVALDSPCTLADLLKCLGLGTGELWIMLVNGSSVTDEFELHDADLVQLIAPIGGG